MTYVNEKLKPCPFCGGEANLGGNNVDVFVECERCSARPYAIPETYAFTQDNQKVSSMWNKRTQRPVEPIRQEEVKPSMIPGRHYPDEKL